MAQTLSPEQALGYTIGTHFTPHTRVVDYFKTVAAANPATVKLQQYGQTNEGRPLMVAFVSSADNISKLESIRLNNLGLAQMADLQTTTATPAIVWLSYNVHGNEASSTEAAMLTLYALADPANAGTKEWLRDVVVAIDPCLNPDGRDRYVAWFNSVVGQTPDPQPGSREHNEPWPGGRTNHYNFDLNRDWVWQTQVESSQRLKLYNSWMPQVHVDFHEQGINSPYYFAPAAQPYHEVITPWQRIFQNAIGRAHAKYFDEKGWLYFTKEEFDLLYPSYGDTYPLYNGAIGMTYEQGGGGRGGLSVLTATDDTLTLYDRALHHYTTGLSTIETAARNKDKLLSEFKKFFTDAVTTGTGPYKTYVIKNSIADADRIQALKTLLDANAIRYGSGKAASLRGFSYGSGKEESFSLNAEDLVISALQPKSTLLKVLFEPQSTLVDSVTYDITAWSLPYTFGLPAYATTQKAEPVSSYKTPPLNNITTDAYGYVIRWNGVSAARLATRLLQKGVRLRFSESAFESGGQSFNPGSVIILKTGNQHIADLSNVVRHLADESGVILTAVSSGFVDKGYDFGSGRIHPLKARKIALLTGEGVGANAAGEVWFFMEKVLNYPVTLINAADVNNVNWNDYDVIIMPDGRYRFLSDKTTADAFRSWVSNGGNIVALEGAVAALSRQDWAIKSKKEEEEDVKDVYGPLRRYEARERDYIPNTTPGSIFRVELDNTHPLAFGYPGYYYTLKSSDAIYDFMKNGWNVGIIRKDKQVAGFVGNKLSKRLQDGLLFGVQPVGRGNITYLTDDVLFRNFWEGGKLLFVNALFLVGQ